MAFEAVLIAALFLAGLAVPAQALETFGLELVGDRFCCACFGARHGGGGGCGLGRSRGRPAACAVEYAVRVDYRVEKKGAMLHFEQSAQVSDAPTVE